MPKCDLPLRELRGRVPTHRRNRRKGGLSTLVWEKKKNLVSFTKESGCRGEGSGSRLFLGKGGKRITQLPMLQGGKSYNLFFAGKREKGYGVPLAGRRGRENLTKDLTFAYNLERKNS